MGPTNPPIRWAPRFLSAEVIRPRRESGHLPQSSAGVKNGEAIHLLSHGVVLNCINTGTD